MADRYFLDQPVAAGRAVLTGAEAHHLMHVLRAKVGGEVTLFDGGGRQYRAAVARIGRSEVELAVLAAEQVDRETARPLRVAAALPKGDRQRWLVEKLVELGAWQLTPLLTARGVAQPTEAAIVRLRRTVVEATKQCGRNRLLEVCQPCTLAEVPLAGELQRRWLAHPGGTALAKLLSGAGTDPPPQGWLLAVGPEGGFTAGELDAAQSGGWELVDLGRRTLRVETAAIALAAALAPFCERAE